MGGKGRRILEGWAGGEETAELTEKWLRIDIAYARD